jgi:hypothetical protein
LAKSLIYKRHRIRIYGTKECTGYRSGYRQEIGFEENGVRENRFIKDWYIVDWPGFRDRV